VYEDDDRGWDVLVLGGPSATGKTTAALALARHLGITVTHVDDLHLAVEAMTSPAQQPVLHFWRTKPDDLPMSPREIVDLHISVCRVLAPAIHAVVRQHVEERMPIVLEGDYVLPEILRTLESVANGTASRVRVVFLDEPDEGQIARNLFDREPKEGEQTGRASVLALFGSWLREECQSSHVPLVLVQPFTDLPQRILSAISGRI
jgi:2-phosphoglycerate kinase